LAAVTGYRASKQQEYNGRIRCTFKKSIILLVLASLLGAWGLHLKSRIHRELRQAGEHNFGQRPNAFGGYHAGMKLPDGKEQPRGPRGPRPDMRGKNAEDFYGRRDSRHLQAIPEGGRRLNSAYDVFDFVNNGVSSGVKEAKINTDKALSYKGKTGANFLDSAKAAAKQSTQGQERLQATAEEPVELVKPLTTEEYELLTMFSAEELAAMETLAELGRLFNDEDEARMVKLTEDLTGWINKYAPTFEDPEALLFEVTGALITEDMVRGIPADLPEEEDLSVPEPE